MNKLQTTNYKLQNRNLAQLLKRRLPARVFRIIRKIGNLAEDNDCAVYIVGGFVRDVLLGVKDLDLDIVVEGDALKFVRFLKEKMDLDITTHPRFGTASATLPCGFKIDIATSRKEYYAHPGALPEVEFSSLKEDLFRRDFTINALAIEISRHNFGRLLDLFDGRKDLSEGKIRIYVNGEDVTTSNPVGTGECWAQPQDPNNPSFYDEAFITSLGEINY